MFSIINCLENGNEKELQDIIEILLEQGIDPYSIITDKLIVAFNDIGNRFRKNELFIPEVLVASRTMNFAVEILKPKLVKDNYSNQGKIVLGTVKEDLHDIGKNIVGSMFKCSGFEVIDLGINVDEESFITAVKENSPDILAMSALLTNTLHQMSAVITKLEEEGLRSKVKVMVGGAPVSEGFARKIKADGYAPDAASAVHVAKKLLSLSEPVK